MQNNLQGLGFVSHYLTVVIIRLFTFCLKKTVKVKIRQGSSNKAIIFICGFSVPVDSWASTIEKAIKTDDTLVVITRRGESSRWRGLIGWSPFWWQAREVTSVIKTMMSEELKDKDITLVGHSIGGHLAIKATTEIASERIKKIVPIALACPFATNMFFNGRLWLKGGLICLPLTFISLIIPFIGVKIFKTAIKGLFTGPKVTKERLREIRKNMVPDSVLVFASCLFLISGARQLKKLRKKWKGKVVLIACPDDAIVKLQDLLKMATSSNTPLVLLDTFTPHCYWEGKEFVVNRNWNILSEHITQ